MTAQTPERGSPQRSAIAMQGQTDRPHSQGKRRFRDKLRDIIHEAEATQEAAARQEGKLDTKVLAMMILVEGYPQAFRDFFYLTQVDSSAAGGGDAGAIAAEETQSQRQGMTAESFKLLRTQLVAAEAAARTGNLRAVYEAYHHLAKYFQQEGNLKRALFFYTRTCCDECARVSGRLKNNKCAEIASSMKWLEGEAGASLALGLVQESLGDLDAAIQYHERHLNVSKEAGSNEDCQVAYNNLIQVYSTKGDLAEKQGNLEEAIRSFEQCMQVAETVEDDAALGMSHYRLGMIYQKQDRFEQSLESHQRFLELSRKSGNRKAEGYAHYGISDCLQKLGRLDQAVASLEAYLELTRMTQPDGQAQACCNLGIIYYNQGKHEEAVMYFEKFFEVARSMTDTAMLDVARFNLGLARGAARQAAFVEVVNSDLPALMNWKNIRLPFREGL